MKATTIILSTLVLLYLLVNYATAGMCPPGFRETDDIERPCSPCQYGTYCPGDGRSYPCPAGTIAPNDQASSCTTCESKRSNSVRTICLRTDAPANAIEINERENIIVNAKNPYYYVTFSRNNYYGTPKSVQLTVRGQGGLPASVYASFETGKPTLQNAQFSNRGVNATISVDNDYTRILYLYIVPDVTEYVIADVKLFRNLDVIANLQPNTVNRFQYHSELAQLRDNMILFKLDNVPAGARVNFTLHCGVTQQTGWPFSYTLYYSTLYNIEYPNENNANIIVQSGSSLSPSTSNIFYVPKHSDQFIIALFKSGTYYFADILASVNFVN